jgi:ribose transport system ATP-binding protein
VRSRKGEVLLEGSSIPPDDPKKSMNAGLALIPADRHKGLVAGLSVAENLTLANLADVSSKGRLNRRAERREVEHWMEHMNIQPRRPGATLSTLSGGNQQKVLLAKWLRLAPKALLMDEPTRGVDVGAKADIYAAIRRAAAERTAVLVASSDPDELSLICDRVMIMRDGVVVTELPGSASAEQINEMTL